MSHLTARLREYGRTPPEPMTLPLAEGELRIRRWLRVLPGKRLVGHGELNGQPVLAKLFIATGAERHWQRESVGIQALQRAALSTPALLASGELAGGGRYLLTEYLTDARSLQQLWDELADQHPGSAAAEAVLRCALTLIGRMHRQGLQQTDLHLGNFLQQGDELYVIDGDAIEVSDPGRPLSDAARLDNLGLFFAQLPPEWDQRMRELLGTYMISCDGGLDATAVVTATARRRQARLQQFLDKTLRDCTQFAVSRRFDRFISVLRSEQALLAPLLADPDSAFAGQPLLKAGGSSTVTRVTLGGRELVVKRYNIKGPGHWLKRFWRPSRAWHSWLAAWRLDFLGIATPQPLAMIERRFGPLRSQAWLISEYCPGENLLQHLGEQGERVPQGREAQQLLRPFHQLHAARISHGDFKATNLLWHQEQAVLIDLDAMQTHDEPTAWQRAWQKDRARFIRNWPEGSALRLWLEANLPG